MRNDNRDDSSWENEAINEGGDRFFDEWEKEDSDGFFSGWDITEGKFKHNSSNSGRTNVFGASIVVVAILFLLVAFLFKGCGIGTILMIDSKTYVTKTARVKMRHKYHLPWGDQVILANSDGFRGYLNIDTGEYDFYYVCEEAKFEQHTNGTLSIKYNEKNRYKLSGGPVEGEIIMTSSDWGDMTLKIEILFEAKG